MQSDWPEKSLWNERSPRRDSTSLSVAGGEPSLPVLPVPKLNIPGAVGPAPADQQAGILSNCCQTPILHSLMTDEPLNPCGHEIETALLGSRVAVTLTVPYY